MKINKRSNSDLRNGRNGGKRILNFADEDVKKLNIFEEGQNNE